MKKLQTKALCEGAIMVALASVLSFIKFFELPQGGSVCIGMLPVIFYSVRWGTKKGLLACFAYGLLQLLLDGAYAWGWASILIDYLLAFTLLGFAGIFRGRKSGIFAGTVVACALRFAAHFVSGITAFRIMAPTELFNTTFANPYLYSAAYNGSYILLDMIFCLAIFALVYKSLAKFILGQDLTK
ncbi:MAG: energy-coupled thiamine transporter ThiT [Oscillospiraceae bacterium]|nr:energy-coupled thiamine transporter ThiT [Oscillospiraceae bacterium]